MFAVWCSKIFLVEVCHRNMNSTVKNTLTWICTISEQSDFLISLFDVPFSYLACRCMCNTSSIELRSYWDDLARRISQSVFYKSKAFSHKNIERHTAHTIVSWPNPKQWVLVHTSDLMMIIRQSIYILSIITKEMGKLKTHSPTYCIMDNWENILNLTHTLDKLYLTGILSSMSSDKVCTMMIMGWCNVQTNEYDLQAKTHPTICTHHKLHNTNDNK